MVIDQDIRQDPTLLDIDQDIRQDPTLLDIG